MANYKVKSYNESARPVVKSRAPIERSAKPSSKPNSNPNSKFTPPSSSSKK